MIELEKIKEELKNRLTEKRYNHSLGTMKAASELAKIYGENEDEAAFAGLIHDIAKELSKQEIENYIDKYNIQLDIVEKNNIGLLHSKIGAIIAKEEFKANLKIQNSIKYHTTGSVEMDNFAKIIYLADKIEENRRYDEAQIFRELAIEDLDKAMLKFLDYEIQRIIKKQSLIHTDAIKLRNHLILKLNDN